MTSMQTFFKENLKWLITLVAGVIVAWTALQGTAASNSVRITRAEERIDDLEDAMVQIAILQENNRGIKEDLNDIKVSIKELNAKLDAHLIQ